MSVVVALGVWGAWAHSEAPGGCTEGVGSEESVPLVLEPLW